MKNNLFNGTIEEFMKLMKEDYLTETMLINKNGDSSQKISSIGEIGSWRNSLQFIYHVFENSLISKKTQIILEYKIITALPGNGKRVDLILIGRYNNKPRMAIIELKQWSDAKRYSAEKQKVINDIYEFSKLSDEDKNVPMVKTNVPYSKGILKHPNYQTKIYESLIKEHILYSGNFEITRYSYLHNLKYANENLMINTDQSKIFGYNETVEFGKELSRIFNNFDNLEELKEKFLNSEIKEIEEIPNILKSIIENQISYFQLTSEQLSIKNEIVHSFINNKNHAYFINGSAGTGKTVLSLLIFLELLYRKINVLFYVSLGEYRKFIKQEILNAINNIDKFLILENIEIDNLLPTTSTLPKIIDNEEREFIDEVVIFDETQRIKRKIHRFSDSRNFMKHITRKINKYIIFYDENQKVSCADFWNEKRIRDYLSISKTKIINRTLSKQLRSSGGFINRVKYLLKYENSENLDFEIDENTFSINILNSFDEGIEMIKEKKSKQIISTYYNKWVSKNMKINDVIDQNKFDFTDLSEKENYLWNRSINKNEEWKGILSSNTVVGMEWDYTLVVIGDDYSLENDSIYYDFSKWKDSGSKKVETKYHYLKKKNINELAEIASSINKIIDFSKFSKNELLAFITGIKSKEDVEKLMKYKEETKKNTMRNILYVLLTRARKGCYIYIKNRELREYIKNFLINKYEN